MELDPGKCKLVGATLVDLYKEVERCFNSLGGAKGLPRVKQADGFLGKRNEETGREEGVLPLLERVAADISKERYLVGLLGVTGAGKSTTINELINRSSESFSLVPEGNKGHPCTNAVMRLGFVGPDECPSYELSYASESEFASRRKSFGLQFGLLKKIPTAKPTADPPVEECTDDQMIAGLQEQINNPNTEAALRDTQLFFLEYLLTAKQHRARYVKPQREKVSGGLKDMLELQTFLKEVVSHQQSSGDPAVSRKPYALLAEVLIRIPLDKAPGDVEMVDMPGVLAKSTQDDKITMKYLDEIDGVCIAISVQNLGLQVFNDLKEALRKRFGDLGGRVWICATKLDSVKASAVRQAEESIFHGILDAVSKWGLQGDAKVFRHVCLLSNEVSGIARRFGPASALSPDKLRERELEIAGALKLKTPDGQIVMPPAFADNRLAAIERAFHYVLDDGGIGRLRGIIQNDLSRTVRAAVTRKAKADLQFVVKECKRLVTHFRSHRSLSDPQRAAAREWHNAFDRVQLSLSQDSSWISEVCDGFRGMMTAEFNQCFEPPRKDEYGRPIIVPIADLQLDRRHDDFAKEVSRKAAGWWLGQSEDGTSDANCATRKIIAGVAELLEEEFHSRVSGPSRGLLDDLIKPGRKFQDIVLRELEKTDVHKSQFKMLTARDLLKDKRANEINAFVYRKMMEGKIENLAFESEHRLRNCIRTALEEVRSELLDLTSPDAETETDPTPPDRYDRFLAELVELEKHIDAFLPEADDPGTALETANHA